MFIQRYNWESFIVFLMNWMQQKSGMFLFIKERRKGK